MPASLRILDASDADDKAVWLAAWLAWPDREVFAHPGYVGLYASDEARPMAALMESNGGNILYPFLLRDLPEELRGDAPAYDLTTPYGYGGPFAWGDVAPLRQAFWSAFDQWCVEGGVVSEFVRLALDSTQLLPFPGTIVERQHNVVRALELPADELWMDVEHKVRKNVKRARRSGVTIDVDLVGERLGTFLSIYEATMDRRDAGVGYYFSADYFETIHRDLPGQFAYFFAMHEGRAVSAELVLVSENALYSFLGGTLGDAFTLRPNDLLKYEVICWGQAEQKSRFVLGGGYAPGDGIYRYKTSFAPNGSVPFCIGTRIHNRSTYEELVGRCKELADEIAPLDADFFPAYRA